MIGSSILFLYRIPAAEGRCGRCTQDTVECTCRSLFVTTVGVERRYLRQVSGAVVGSGRPKLKYWQPGASAFSGGGSVNRIKDEPIILAWVSMGSPWVVWQDMAGDWVILGTEKTVSPPLSFSRNERIAALGTSLGNYGGERPWGIGHGGRGGERRREGEARALTCRLVETRQDKTVPAFGVEPTLSLHVRAVTPN